MLSARRIVIVRKMVEVEIPEWRAVQAYVGSLTFLGLVGLVWICSAVVSPVIRWCSNVVDVVVAKETSSVEVGAYVGAEHDAVMRDVSRRRVSTAKVEKTSQLDCDSRNRARPGSKFYAVRKGRRPGMYFSWSDCSKEVTGFSGAEHRSFKVLEDAEAYLFQSPL